MKNKGNRKLQILILGLLILTFNNCKDKIEVRRVGQETKDFCVYNAGSWWVYQNSRTNEIDTWRILSSDRKEIIQKKNEVSYELFIMFLKTDIATHFELNVEPNYSIIFIGNPINQLQPVYFEGSKEDYIGCGNNLLHLIRTDSLDGICVVKEFKYNNIPCVGILPIQYTWKRKFGIQQMIYANNDTLKLIDFKIN